MNFDRLPEISAINAWKKAYEQEIAKFDLLCQEEERLYYDLYTGGEPSERLEEIQKIKHALMTNEKVKENISFWKEEMGNDPVWHRRLIVFLTSMEQEALDSHPELSTLQRENQKFLLESSFAINGQSYNLGAVHSNIMENPDRELRKQLLQGAQKIGQRNEVLFRKLILKRNELARKAGFENYYHFKCHIKEIDFESYLNMMESLLEKSAESSECWTKRLKEKFGWEVVHHYDHYFSTFHYHEIDNRIFTSDHLRDVVIDIAASLGVDAGHLPFNVENMEIPYGGFCININPEEIKLVVNKRDSYSVFLSAIHEMGHALDGYFSSFKYPELYRFYSSIAAEGIAELFQTIVSDPEFLTKNFEIDENTRTKIEEINQLTDLTMVKINYYYSLVEYEIYKSPERDFQEVAQESYLHVYGERGETFHPASEMFYVENPAFFQDYNFALAIRDMIRHHFKLSSPYGKKEFFEELLDKYIQPAQLFSWKERVHRLCGEPHTFTYLARNLESKSGC